MSKKWVRYPGPGQFRSQGDWFEVGTVVGLDMEYYNYCVATGWLPTHEGDTPPEDAAPEGEVVTT